MKIVKTRCDKCGMMIRNNSIKKHYATCNGEQKLSWFIRKANNLEIKIPRKLEDINWSEIQFDYDTGMSTSELCNKYNITFTHISKAGKLELFMPRSRSQTANLRGNSMKGKTITNETRQKISAGMRKAVLEGRQRTPKPYGRATIEYKGVILQSNWELQVALYLDEHNIRWERPSIGHEYTFENKSHLYFPDFYLLDYNTYIEVKGWKQPKDDCKWEDFKHELVIIDKHSIKNLAHAFEKVVGPVRF